MDFSARTRDSVLRALAALAMQSNLLHDEKEYYQLPSPTARWEAWHHHMLARIALLLQKTDLANAIRDCSDPETVMDALSQIEAEFIAKGL